MAALCEFYGFGPRELDGCQPAELRALVRYRDREIKRRNREARRKR